MTDPMTSFFSERERRKAMKAIQRFLSAIQTTESLRDTCKCYSGTDIPGAPLKRYPGPVPAELLEPARILNRKVPGSTIIVREDETLRELMVAHTGANFAASVGSWQP